MPAPVWQQRGRAVLAFVCWTALLVALVAAAQPPLADADLVLARGTCGSRLDLAHATGRAGRDTHDVRTVYVLDSPAVASELQSQFGATRNETYLYWPDRPDPKKPGDSRVAMVPWLAHKALGDTYKWLLYGDDDTFFFIDAVKDLLREYDPDLPYVVTDVLWHKRKRYLTEAPRCLPCHVTEAFREFVAARPDKDPPRRSPGAPPIKLVAPPIPPRGCPCTPELACEYTLNVTGRRKLLRRSKPMAWSPESVAWGFPAGYPTVCDYPHFHGGSGVLISVGAMRKVSYEAALDCYYDDTAELTAIPRTLKADAHGDRMTSLCFWMHGVGITDPGLSLTSTRLEFSDIKGRVMDARTANLDVLQQALDGLLSDQWLMQLYHQAAVHVGHHERSERTTWRFAEVYPLARAKAEEVLKAHGTWDRSDHKLQVLDGEALRRRRTARGLRAVGT